MPSVDDVARALGGPLATEPADAAVLLALAQSPQGAQLLYIKRALTLRAHAGEWAFPGGRAEPADDAPLTTALRETHEEVGMAPVSLDVLGHVTHFTTHYGTTIAAYAARMGPDKPYVASPDEVDEIHQIPIAHLLDPQRYESRWIDGMQPDRRVHYWHLDPGTMWGITGELTARFLERVWKWQPSSPPTVINDPSQFRPQRIPPRAL